MSEIMSSVLFVSILCLQMALGSMLILSFRKTVAADWIDGEKENLKKLVRIIYFLPIPFLFIFWQRQALFPWSHEVIGGFTKIYFNPTFFFLRNAIEFALWIWLASRLISDRQKTGALPMILILLTVTFASYDWILSLDLQWRSNAFGIVFLASALLGTHGLSLSLLKHPPNLSALRDLNTIHFTLIGVWVYLSLMQFLIVWSGNLPDEVTLYTNRIETSWRILPQLLIILQFATLMFLLLFRRLKESMLFTRSAGAVSFVSQILFVFWLIIPTFHQTGLSIMPIHILAFISLGVLWCYLNKVSA